jgi:hypothetical protein
MTPDQPQETPRLPTGPAETAATAGLSSNPTPQGQPAAGQAAQHESRPPGELGGHTVQPWEQGSASGLERKPSSKDVPPPQAGAAEAKAPSPGPGKVTTPAPGNVPSWQGQPGGAASAARPGPADAGAEAQAQAATPAESASADDKHAAAPAASRPARPPVYSPQQGHEPAPRPPPSHLPAGAGTEGDHLVEAISRAIAENLGKAFHQSVAQAVREVFPLSAKTVDSGLPSSNGSRKGAAQATPAAAANLNLKPAAKPAKAATPAQPAKGQVTPQPPAPRSPPAATDAAPASPPSPTASGQTAAPDGRTGPAKSMYGGTIEPPVPAPADKSPPGNAAAASADEKTRDGDLA